MMKRKSEIIGAAICCIAALATIVAMHAGETKPTAKSFRQYTIDVVRRNCEREQIVRALSDTALFIQDGKLCMPLGLATGVVLDNNVKAFKILNN
jgi:hypothetical protein